MKKFISLFLSIIMLISAVFTVNLTAFATTYSGGCGDGGKDNTVSYVFDDTTGVLIFSGEGDMRNFTTGRPLFGNNDKLYKLVTSVIFGSKITSIGDELFRDAYYINGNLYSESGFPNIVNVTIGTSVETIGNYAFDKCSALTSIIIPNSVKQINKYAFSGCSSLSDLKIGTGLETIGQGAFYKTNLQGIVNLPNSLTSIGQSAFFGNNTLDKVVIRNADCEIYNAYDTFASKTIICGHIGSTAQEYAETYSREFEAIYGETITVVPPTCDEQGYTLHKCKDGCGGEYKTDYVDALGHNEVAVNYQAPTCTIDGVTNGIVCSNCDEVLSGSVVIPATGHTQKVTKSAVAPTCTKTGLTEEIVCTTCKETIQAQTVVKANGHTRQVIPAVLPTCTNEGLSEGYKCSVCGVILEEQEETEKLVHTSVTKNAVTATCKAEGYTGDKYCSRCNIFLEKGTTIPKSDHKYTTKITASTCAKQGYTTYTCSVCGWSMKDNYTDVIDHKYAKLVTMPTCTEKGYTTHTCSVCGDSFVDTYTNPTGHTEKTINQTSPTCISNGYTGDVVCSICGEELLIGTSIDKIAHNYSNVVIAPTCSSMGYTTKTCKYCKNILVTDYADMTEHSYVTSVVSPTCSEKGHTIYTCEDCGDSFETDYTNKVAHSYKNTVVEPTCTQKGYTNHSCKNCGYSYNDTYVEMIDHIETTINVKSATCSENGYSGDVICSVCNEKISSGALTDKIAHSISDKIIAPTCTERGYTVHSCANCDFQIIDSYVDALGHTEEVLTGVNATCTDSGLTEGKCCTTCNKILVEQQIIAKKQHEYTSQVTAVASCTSRGVTTYTCKNCSESYEIYDNAKNHNYIEKTIVNATCTQKGLKEFKCEKCSESYYVELPLIEHTVVIDNALNATCKTTGLTEGSHCSTCGKVLVAQTTVNTTGHTPKSAVEENRLAPTCQKAGSIDSVVYCSTCNEELSRTTTVIPVAEHKYAQTVVAPTCETKGYTLYRCTDCGESYKDAYTDTVAHSYKEVTTKQPTCTEMGVAKYTCTICGDTYNTDIEMIEHTAVTDNAVAPTCITTGLTEGSHCSVCGTVLVAQTVVPAKGHSYTTKVVKPTYATKGYTLHTCSVCKASYKDAYTNKLTVAMPTISKVESPKSKQIKVTWGKKSYTGYQVQIATDSKFTKNTKSATIKKASTVSTTFTKLKGKTKYYVRVRAYKTYNGKNYYSAWSSVKTVTTKK